MTFWKTNPFMILLLSLFIISFLGCGSGTETSVKAGVIKEGAAALTEQEQAQLTENTVPISQGLDESSSFYHTVPLYGGKLKVFVPVSFTEMPSDKIAMKYPNAGNRPNVVYTNEHMSVNLAFTQIAIPTEQENLLEVKEVLSEQLKATKPMNFQSRIEKIDGFDYIIFEFESRAIDTKIYNLMFATDIDSKLLLGTFNCTEALKVEWQSKAKEILLSMRKG